MDKEKKEFILRELGNAIALLNGRAQTSLTGLDPDLDNVRQNLCNAYGVLSGEVMAGNLRRVSETRHYIKRYNAEQ